MREREKERGREGGRERRRLRGKESESRENGGGYVAEKGLVGRGGESIPGKRLRRRNYVVPSNS